MNCLLVSVLNILFVYPIIYVYTTIVIVVEVTEELSTHEAVWSVHEQIMTLFCSFSSIKKYISFVRHVKCSEKVHIYILNSIKIP